MGIAELADGLVVDADGILTCVRGEVLSYPEEGNRACFLLEDRSYWFLHRNDCILAALKRFPPGGPVLDVGGGNGFVTRRMLDEGFDAALLEPGVAGARNAKRARRIPEVICATFEDAGFPAGSLCAVGCFDVIEHVEGDDAFLAMVQSRLKPGGLLYATVPAHAWLWSCSDVVAGHFRRYNLRMIRALLAPAFELLYFTHFFGVLTLPVLLLRALPFRLHLLKREGGLPTEAEHGAKGGCVVSLLKRFLRRELARLREGKSSGVGTSCLFVARKKRTAHG